MAGVNICFKHEDLYISKVKLNIYLSLQIKFEGNKSVLMRSLRSSKYVNFSKLVDAKEMFCCHQRTVEPIQYTSGTFLESQLVRWHLCKVLNMVESCKLVS